MATNLRYPINTQGLNAYELFNKVADFFDMDPDDLVSSTNRIESRMALMAYTLIARFDMDIQAQRVAKLLGMTNPTISHYCKSMEDSLRSQENYEYLAYSLLRISLANPSQIIKDPLLDILDRAKFSIECQLSISSQWNDLFSRGLLKNYTGCIIFNAIRELIPAISRTQIANHLALDYNDFRQYLLDQFQNDGHDVMITANLISDLQVFWKGLQLKADFHRAIAA